MMALIAAGVETHLDVSAQCFVHPASDITGGAPIVAMPDGSFAYAFRSVEPQVFGLYRFNGKIGGKLTGEHVGWLVLKGSQHEPCRELSESDVIG